MSRLRPQDLGSATKPLSRVAYAIGTSGRGYRVEVFASVLDATTSFTWQMIHPSANLVWLSAPASLPGLRLYTVGGYAVAAVLYRNVEFVVSVPIQGAGAASVAATLALTQAVVALSSGFVGSGAPLASRAGSAVPIFPPPFTFIFGDLGVYRVNATEQRGQDQRFFDYSFQPNGLTGAVTRDYHIALEPSAPRALSMVASAVRTFTGTYHTIGFRRVDLTGTALADPALHAWTAVVPALHCDVWAVFAYRNLWFLLADSTQDACSARVQDTLALEIRLLQTADAYVQAQQV
jgi:hypothetical protein